MNRPKTIGALRQSGYQVVSVKEEMRHNLIRKLKRQESLFPGIIGFENTVIPELVNAILAKHDMILLGLRGQAKTRILRALIGFLDDAIPIIVGCEINDNPFAPLCKTCRDKVRTYGDEVPIAWLPRQARYGEKLATPDVTIADLIGDIDPIKAATHKLHYAHEGIIHFGIIPRTNRGIFAINELPDLQPRIQVGLLNIMQEKDIQIRGFPVRLPLDVVMVYSANPEDYTNRGNIITPLKDRIGSQIMTHYPLTIEDGIQITAQEAWINRGNGEYEMVIPYFFREIIEEVAFQARKSEFIDQNSGVSARLTITCLENLVSNMERRALLTGDRSPVSRICDLPASLPAMTGKMELVYEGEQHGPTAVATMLLGRAVKEVFKRYFPDAYDQDSGVSSARHRTTQAARHLPKQPEKSYYQSILDWFEEGNQLEITDFLSAEEYFRRLDQVPGLRTITAKHLKTENRNELAAAMEFLLEGLHQNSRISKEKTDGAFQYRDMLGSIFDKDTDPWSD